jgi:hypothetical protein
MRSYGKIGGKEYKKGKKQQHVRVYEMLEKVGIEFQTMKNKEYMDLYYIIRRQIKLNRHIRTDIIS